MSRGYRCTLPAPFVAVHLEAYRHPDGSVMLEYSGSPSDLVAAGVATQEMVGPGVKGRARYSPDGYQFRRTRVDRNGRICIHFWDLPAEAAQRMPGVPAEADLPVRFSAVRWLESRHPLVRALQRRYPALSVEAIRHYDDQGYCLKFGAPDRATLEAARVISPEHLTELLALSKDARRSRHAPQRCDGFGNLLLAHEDNAGTYLLQHVCDVANEDVEARVDTRRMRTAVRKLLRPFLHRRGSSA